MADIVDLLRGREVTSLGAIPVMEKAADEIERLRAEVAKWRDLAQPQGVVGAPFNGDFS